MERTSNYNFMVGSVTIISGILALACMWIGILAVEYNFEAFSNPSITLQYAHNYQLAKWFNLLDLFGYYLLLLPLVFYIHQQYKFRSPWMPLITFSGAAYVLVGSIGAAILAALWPEHMKTYMSATPENQKVITSLFETTTSIVTKGLWNILEVLFASIWWIGIGKLLYNEKKWIGCITVGLGVATLSDAIGNILELQLIADLGLNIYLLLAIIWPIIIGIKIVKKSCSVHTPENNH